jgi:hypothetical protein
MPTRAHSDESRHRKISQADRAAGWSLACQTFVHGDLAVEVPLKKDEGLKILREGQTVAVDIAPWFEKSFDPVSNRTAVIAGGRIVASESGDTTAALYGAAIDIGTTTMVVALVDLRDGRELAHASALNPQARHAQDVLSRIKLGSTPEGLRTLHTELIAELNRLLAEAATEAQIDPTRIYEAVFSGNTTMCTWQPPPIPPRSQVSLHAATSRRRPRHRPPPSASNSRPAARFICRQSFRLRRRRHHFGTAFDRPRGAQRRHPLRRYRHQRREVLRPTANRRHLHRRRPRLRGHEHRLRHARRSRPIEFVSLAGDAVELRTIGNTTATGLCGSGLLDAVGELAATAAWTKWPFPHQRLRARPSWKDRLATIDGKPAFRLTTPLPFAKGHPPGAARQGRRAHRHRVAPHRRRHTVLSGPRAHTPARSVSICAPRA